MLASALRALTAIALAAPQPEPPPVKSPIPVPVVREATRSTMRVMVQVSGTIVPEDVARINSPIDGRVEEVPAKPYAWARRSTDLAFLVNDELAAMIDSRGTATEEMTVSRWRRVFKPLPVRCPGTCFILRSFAKPKKTVRMGAALFETAGKLRLIGRVRAGDTRFVRDGQLLTFWDSRAPARRLQGRVERFILDFQGGTTSPGGSFSVLLGEKFFLPPGTEWEGEILASEKRDALRVPTGALMRYGDDVFLPVRVSTGLTTYGETEIISGIWERTKYLVLDPSRLGLKSHEPPSAPPPDRPAAPPPGRMPKGERPRPEPEKPPEGLDQPAFVEPGADYPSDLNGGQ